MKRYLVAGLMVFVIASLVFSAEAFSLEIKSGAFSDGEMIPDKYTCKGADVSPSLAWTDVPGKTKSFVLIMDDPDAPLGTWIHWVVYNIPADVRTMSENIPKKMRTSDGALQGLNSFRWVGYGGPCPPPGPKHRYMFKLYALDTMLDLKAGSSKGDVMREAQGHILDQATLMGVFSR